MRGNLRPTFAAAILGAALAGSSVLAGAAGYALSEQSASGTGNAFAGGAASAEDASTIFFNPAGMTQLPGRQIVVGLHAIRPTDDFSNQGSFTAGGPLTGGNGGDAGDWNFVPNLYLSWQLTNDLWAGVGVNVPFGLRTQYDPGWVGRYQALTSDLKTININPSLAYKVNDKVSLGVGVSAQQAKATLNKAIDSSTVCLGSQAAGLLPAGTCTATGLNIPQTRDAFQELTADAWGYGFNLGALFQISSDMRVGVSYRSQIKYELSGTSTFSNVPFPLTQSNRLQTSAATADITVPQSASVSVFQTFGPEWELMGDITWTGWSVFDELRVKFANGAPDNVTPENWRDTWRLSLGLNYKMSDAWKLRTGVAWDQTPVKDSAARTPRIPDNSRTWVAVGASWYFTKGASLDFGYAHLFVPSTSINHTEPAAGTLVGTYDANVNILSLQMTYSF